MNPRPPRLVYTDKELNALRTAFGQLVEQPTFTVWWFKLQREKWGKQPLHPHGTRGVTFDEALAMYNKQTRKLDGLGVKFGPLPHRPEVVLFGVDYDGKEKGPIPEPWPKTETYSERSPSGGDKFHLLGVYKGKALEGKKSKDEAVEVYTQGRFFTLTGKRINGAKILLTDPLPYYAAIGVAEPKLYGVAPAVAIDVKVAPIAEADLTPRERELLDKVRGFKHRNNSSLDFKVCCALLERGATNEQVARVMCAGFWRDDNKLAREDGYLGTTIANAALSVAAERDPERAFRERSREIGKGDEPSSFPTLYDLKQMLKEVVYIEEGAQVVLRADPRFAQSFVDFQNSTAASVKKAVAEDDEPNKGGRPSSVARAWLRDRQRVTVNTRTFKAGGPLFCNSPDDRRAINTWREPPRTAPPADWRDVAAPLFEHIAFLVPEPAECEQFLDWLAHIEQKPGVLPHHHYLMVTKQQGVGRNLLSAILARVWPGIVALDVNLPGLLEGGFNGAISRKVVAVCNELREGGGGAFSRKRAETLKSYLTDEHRYINPKYGREHVEFNAARWLMFSNHIDALPLDEQDRRIVVIENPSEAKDAAYYTKMYALVERREFVASVREALRVRDISQFNPGRRAAINAAKLKVVEASMSEADHRMRELIATYPADAITSPDMQLHLFDGVPSPSDHARLRHIAQRAGAVRVPKKIWLSREKNQTYIWILRNAAMWEAATPAQLDAEVTRGDEACRKEREEQAKNLNSRSQCVE